METKKCKKCKKNQPVSNFYKFKTQLNSYCKPCTLKLMKTPNYREQNRKSCQKWRENNRERHREMSRIYRLKRKALLTSNL